MACGHQFRAAREINAEELWSLYADRKQTVAEIATTYKVSVSTIKRRLHDIEKKWVHTPLSGSGFVHIDATYWGRSWGILLALDEKSGKPLFLKFITNECAADYEEAVASIERRGYTIKGLIIDGKKALFSLFSTRKIQMCQFHMTQIIKRYLTKNPKLLAARELKKLMKSLPSMEKEAFEGSYTAWKQRWSKVLNKRSTLKDGRTQYTHKRLRSAMHSIDFFRPYLFTYQLPECSGMPNTNNKIEGTFSDLKKNLNTHSGMSKENRKRFISGFFLAYEE